VRVPAGDDESRELAGDRPGRSPIGPRNGESPVCLDVVDRDERDAEAEAIPFARKADEKRADEPGTGGRGHERHVAEGDASLG